MNQYMQRLLSIASKETRHIIGLMSGTSLDGLDIALCAISGHGVHTKVDLLHFTTVAYDDEIRSNIKKVFARSTIDFQTLCLLNPWIAKKHAAFIADALKEWNVDAASVDLIASHGQTVYHSPRILHQLDEFPNATLQIGDGDHIAVDTGIITISDFRQKHIAAGGEGAPLALYGDYCIFSKKGENRILLNMGGIANFTFLPAGEDDMVWVTDTGPGNTMIDALAQSYFNKPYDDNAGFAKQGKVNEALLSALKADRFFDQPFPKTTGPELFNLAYIKSAQSASATNGIDKYDLIATLTRFSADTIVTAIRSLLQRDETYHVYLSGGGAHNPLLINWIAVGLPGIELHHTSELGIPGDAKEAVLFAVLANETVAGGPLPWHVKKEMPSVTMGKISFPG